MDESTTKYQQTDFQKRKYVAKDLTPKQALLLLPEPFKELDLTPKELTFIAMYCSNGFDKSRAAIDSGLATKKSSPQLIGARSSALLYKPAVQEAIRIFLDQVLGPYKARLEYIVLETYYRRATYDVGIFFDLATGLSRPLSAIPHEWRCVIDGIDVSYAGKDATVKVINYRLANRDTALQTLGKLAIAANPSNNANLPKDSQEFLKSIFNNAVPITLNQYNIHQG